ncbi:MAG: PLP-dependent aspartate aminotransferase family protein [Oscillospiraceae bacterium]|jgi:cystathionine beta-lyase/cystathionine gamma-synthase|nr:PLP-dependent aspartate aminotransferase family protein [Oscillospiraceae bacterium]
MDISTLCLHGGRYIDPTGAVVTPIFQSATFAHPGVGQSTGYDYSRGGNPTRAALETLMAKLEGAEGAVAFSSGMAAISAAMELFAPGDHLVIMDDLYGGTKRLFAEVSAKYGVTFTQAATPLEVERAATAATRGVFVETPSNPMMKAFDIAAAAELAHKIGALLIVDNTFLTPYFQNPIALGADIVIHSGTKYLGGHNDTLAGFLCAATKELTAKIRRTAMTTGAALSPFDAFLIQRGIKTLPVRMERAQNTAGELARWLGARPEVTRVYYPGLAEHPDYDLMRRQARGFGAMISFAVKAPEIAVRLLQNVEIIQYAESLGGTDTLITYPILQTHADVPEEERLALGIDDKLMRISVGLEAAEDLLADLACAFEA